MLNQFSEEISYLSFLSILVTIFTPIVLVIWRQNKKIKVLKKYINDIDNEEASRTGNLLFDAVIPNVEAVKAKIFNLISETKKKSRILRIDNYGLDLETIGVMFNYTFIESIAKRDIYYRGIVIDPESECIKSFCINGSNVSQDVARDIIYKIKNIRDSPSLKTKIRSYNIPPIIHGFLIDDEHLFIGFTELVNGGLLGGASPYIYIKRDTSSEFKEGIFRAYQSWFEYWMINGVEQVPSNTVDKN